MQLAQPISPIVRLDMHEEYRELAALAIRHRHKSGWKLAHTRPESLADEQLAETILRLKGWLAEQPELPVHPDSWAARKGA